MPYLNDVHNYTIFLIGVHDTYVQNSKNEECHIHMTHELHANPSFFFMLCRRQVWDLQTYQSLCWWMGIR